VKVGASSLSLTLIGAAAMAMALWSGASSAQAIDQSTTFNPNNTLADSFNRGQNVSVRQRPRPDYQAAGIHVGGFMIFPKITGSVGYDDNIYALQSHAVGDTIFTVAPEIDVQSTWSRNALAAYVRASQDWYVTHSSENATQYGAGIDGKFEFGESTLTGGVDYGHYVLPRSAANNGILSKNRIGYDYTALNAQLSHTFNRLRLSGRADYQIYDYQNGRTAGGALVFQKDQNRKVATFIGRAEYAVSPDTAIFVAGAYNDRQYDFNPPTVLYSRDSSGYDIGGGANFDLSHLLRGEIQLGYLNQHYRSPLFKPISGLSAKAQLEWFATQLTSVTATAFRSVGDSGIINSAGYLTTVGGLQVDHELLRNVILTGNASIGHDQYYGISRIDDHWGLGASANWLVTRRLGLTLAYGHSNQQSSGAQKGPSFSDNRVSLSAVVQF
jgi:hypothetical protein